MTKIIPSLSYVASSDNSEYIATVEVDASVDSNWDISLQGAVDGGPQNIAPNFATIDNYSNDVNCVVTIGQRALTVGAFTRSTFQLPAGLKDITITVPSGETTVYVAQTSGGPPDDADYLAIQRAAMATTVFPWVTYTAPISPQQATDEAKHVKLVPVGGALSYELLLISGNVDNGWFQKITNAGNFPALLVPNGGDTINNLFSVANPFILYPGEECDFASDGAQWYAAILAAKPATVPFTVTPIVQTAAHEFRRLTFGAVVAQAYDLLSAADFANGWHTHIKNTGTANLSIVPNGADEINAFWTNVAPLVLAPGDRGDLFINDQGLWKFEGSLSFISAEQPYGTPSSGVIPHGLSIVPSVELWIRCKTAEAGYNVGDEFLMGNTQSASSVAGAPHSIRVDFVNITYALTTRTTIRIPSTAGVDTTPAVTGNIATNFVAFFKARAQV